MFRLAVLIALSAGPLTGMAAAGSEPAAAAEASRSGSAVLVESEQAPRIDLAVPYVPPPHVPGAKVRTPEGVAPLLVERLAKERPVNVLTLANAVPVGNPATSMH